MTGRNSLLPRIASQNAVSSLLSLLLVVLFYSAPAAPASSVGRQGPGGDAGPAGGRGVLSSVWRHGGSSHPLRSDDSSDPESDGGVVGSRTWEPGDGDYSDTPTMTLQRRRHLYEGKYPVSRKIAHRSHGSLDADGRSSENSKSSSSSFFISSDWNEATSSSGRKGPRDIRPGNWPQEAGEFERVSSLDESRRKASESQHKSSIMRGRGEGRRARGGEVISRRGREVLEDNFLASGHNDYHPNRNIAHVTFDGGDSTGYPAAPLRKTLSAIEAEGTPDVDNSFGVPVDSVSNSDHILPSINPELFPLREHQWHSERGTMPLEAPQAGFSDSWGHDAYGENLEPGLADNPYDLEEVLAREEAALEANTLMVQLPELE